MMFRKTAAAILAAFFLVSGCGSIGPSIPIQTGDRIRTDYTCRVKEGEVIETTVSSVADDPSVKKSRVFIKKEAYGPVTIIAGQDQPGRTEGDLKPITPEIRSRIAKAMAGQAKNKAFHLDLESRVPEGIDDSVRYSSIQRVRRVPRFRTLDKDLVVRSLGREPVAGEVFSNETGPYLRIVSVDGDKVTQESIVHENSGYWYRWGMIRKEYDGDEVVVTIDAQEGDLARTGEVIGRVVKVTENTITVDWGHIFGGETLKCDVMVLEDEKPDEQKPKEQK
nr:hypothetical protein [Desulfobacula sp.]